MIKRLLVKEKRISTGQLADYSEWWIIKRMESLRKENDELRKRLSKYE